ncbi:spermidine/putrescine ABC transporter permease protein [Vagococcus lutrae]|nr:spermidine/putrescine ABC transporter permease protein [Vagococcus lutrae]GEQ62735.1 spermidine/putrescine ABC transporter permease protein [Vagococcus lutrae]GEQ64487.1 spermidine/putrescine ABC transporter permease protein [Vagococcus lutrae]
MTSKQLWENKGKLEVALKKKKSFSMNSWQNKSIPYLFVLPAFSIVMLFIVYPIITMVIRSFQDSNTKAFTLDNYKYFFTDSIQMDNLVFTLKIVIVTVIFSLLLGYLLALFIKFSDSKVSELIATLNLAPRFIPGLVAVYAVILVIRDSGVVNRVSKLFGLDIKLGWMYNETGIIIMNLWFNIPFVSLLILASLSGIKKASIEAAKDIGANNWLIFQKIILPETYREIMVAMTFVFMGNVGSFTTPFLMGGNHPKMLGIALYDQFNSYMNYERTAALSVIMFLLCSVSAVFYIRSNMKENI